MQKILFLILFMYVDQLSGASAQNEMVCAWYGDAVRLSPAVLRVFVAREQIPTYQDGLPICEIVAGFDRVVSVQPDGAIANDNLLGIVFREGHFYWSGRE